MLPWRGSGRNSVFPRREKSRTSSMGQRFGRSARGRRQASSWCKANLRREGVATRWWGNLVFNRFMPSPYPENRPRPSSSIMGVLLSLSQSPQGSASSPRISHFEDEKKSQPRVVGRRTPGRGVGQSSWPRNADTLRFTLLRTRMWTMTKRRKSTQRRTDSTKSKIGNRKSKILYMP